MTASMQTVDKNQQNVDNDRIQKNQTKKIDYFTKTGLKDRGWNDKQITKILGVPDKEATNPYYRAGPPVCLYEVSRVLAAETTEQFLEHKKKNDKRSEAAYDAACTRRKKTFKRIEDVEIVLPKLTLDKLAAAARENYNIHHYEAITNDRKERIISFTSWDQPDAFRDRVCVNYLRHRGTDYEYIIESIKGATGKEDARIMLREKIVEKIIDMYPELEEEAERQLENNMTV